MGFGQRECYQLSTGDFPHCDDIPGDVPTCQMLLKSCSDRSKCNVLSMTLDDPCTNDVTHYCRIFTCPDSAEDIELDGTKSCAMDYGCLSPWYSMKRDEGAAKV